MHMEVFFPKKAPGFRGQQSSDFGHLKCEPICRLSFAHLTRLVDIVSFWNEEATAMWSWQAWSKLMESSHACYFRHI